MASVLPQKQRQNEPASGRAVRDCATTRWLVENQLMAIDTLPAELVR